MDDRIGELRRIVAKEAKGKEEEKERGGEVGRLFMCIPYVCFDLKSMFVVIIY